MIPLAGKPKFKLDFVLPIANDLHTRLAPLCLRSCIAGSIRRQKPLVGDIEVLFIPCVTLETTEGELFPKPLSTVTLWIEELQKNKILAPRLKRDGSQTYGSKIKLMTHVETGIPIDFFTATETNWWNNLVCRTGSREHNIKLASRALELGFGWEMMGDGFVVTNEHAALQTIRRFQLGIPEYAVKLGARIFCPQSEEEVFTFLQIPYLLPEQR